MPTVRKIDAHLHNKLRVKRDTSYFTVFGDIDTQHPDSSGNELDGLEITSHVWLDKRITKSMEIT